MPLVWASRLAGTPLPERVCGSSLIWSLAAGLGRDGRSVYLLGGEPAPEPAPLPGRAGARGRPAPADRRRGATAPGGRRSGSPTASPGLRIAGWHSPAYGFDRDAGDARAGVRAPWSTARPDLVYVGIGFPKQEWVISRLRADLPGAWFLGCGAAINFVGRGPGARAEVDAAHAGWSGRIGWPREPRRLAGRYVRHDAPYALRLLAGACAARYRRATLAILTPPPAATAAGRP